MSAINAVKHDNYDTEKLNSLYEIIQNGYQNNQPKDYEILVDEMRVVPRTSNPEMFNNLSNFIQADSKTVLVKMFRGNSNQQDKYFFHIKGVPQKEQSLNGIPEGLTQDEFKNKLLKDIRYDTLEKENEELKSKLAKSEKANEDLAVQFEQLKEGQLISLGDVGMALVKKFLTNPEVQKSLPMVKGLAGVISPENTEIKPEETATFKPKGQPEIENVPTELTEEEQNYLGLIRQLQERLNEGQLTSVMHILSLLTQCPQSIGSATKCIQNFINSHKEPNAN